MGKDPAMPFYVNDWLSSSSVQRMGLVEQAAYMRLLAFCWASGNCSLPEDETELLELAGLSEPIGWGHPDDIANGSLNRCQQVRWDLIRERLTPHPWLSHRLTNGRLFELWTERQQYREERQRSGAAGAAKRWGKPNSSKKKRLDSSAISLPLAKDSSSSSSSSSNKKETKAKKARTKFQPPTIEQVQALCQKRGYHFDPVAFLAHYKANGWVQSRGKPIVDWEAACVTWERFWLRDHPPQQSRLPTPEDDAQWTP